MEVRCAECGYLTWFRAGARHCAGCAAPLAVASPCPTCGVDVLPDERHCVSCGGALVARMGSPTVAAAMSAPSTVGGAIPAAEIAALRELAAASAGRLAAEPSKAPAPAKPHLDQDDIDALFA